MASKVPTSGRDERAGQPAAAAADRRPVFPPPPPPQPCEVCNKAASVYRCPGCDRRSCSVGCVKKHKEDAGCSGERSKTHFVRLKDFRYSDLMSDYSFLEDVARCVDNAARENSKHLPLRNPANARRSRGSRKKRPINARPRAERM